MKVTEEMIRDCWQKLATGPLSMQWGDCPAWFRDAAFKLCNELITRWEAEHFQHGNDIMRQVREKFPKLEAFDDDELLRLVLFICGPRPMEVQQGPPDLDWVPDDVLFVIPYTNQKAGVPNLQSAKVIRGWDSDVFDAIRWYICLGVITPPAEQPEPPKCKICGEPVKPEQQRRHATPVRLGEIVAEHCDLMTCIQSLREALAAARKAGG